MRLLAAGVEDQLPAIVILDEFPYLVADDPSLEATFQKLWDRVLSKKRILLILVGSDLATLESLDDYDRAFHQRGTPFAKKIAYAGTIKWFDNAPLDQAT